MPAGTVGVEAVGKVTEDDYRDVLVPAVTRALESKDVRLLYVLGDDFDAYSVSAMWADATLWAGHVQGWLNATWPKVGSVVSIHVVPRTQVLRHR